MKALTRHRELILSDLKARTDHPTAKMVFETVKDKADKISFATVYNSLEYLVSHGLVRKLNLEADSVHYDALLEDHSHLVCKDCGRIFDVPKIQPTNGLNFASLGFTIQHVDVTVSGTCQNCQKP